MNKQDLIKRLEEIKNNANKYNYVFLVNDKYYDTRLYTDELEAYDFYEKAIDNCQNMNDIYNVAKKDIYMFDLIDHVKNENEATIEDIITDYDIDDTTSDASLIDILTSIF